MLHISAKPHRERMASVELRRHLCRVADHLDVQKRPPTLWGMARATARVPTPLHTTPALTMTTYISSTAARHSKGGSGVERGGDPCGRPGGFAAQTDRKPTGILCCPSHVIINEAGSLLADLSGD